MIYEKSHYLIVLTGGKITRNTCSKDNTERLEVSSRSREKRKRG
jgi:hypothetical protein